MPIRDWKARECQNLCLFVQCSLALSGDNLFDGSGTDQVVEGR